jgi:poly-gamma-glutamate synthesis protein (capsule biosynthesis protein)
VRSSLPSWLAPGARFAVSGFAGGGADVTLTSDGAVVARAVAGRLGRFVLAARAPAPGRHRLVVLSRGRRASAGTLVVRPLVLAAVGDVTPGEDVGPAVRAHGGAYPWRAVGQVLARADVAVANLEGAISSRGEPWPDKEFHFEGPAALLEGARSVAGIDVLTLANNHSLDYGAVALFDSLRAAHAAGIQTIGAGANSAAARRPAFVEAGGVRIALLGYSDISPYEFFATRTSPGTAGAVAANVAADVRAARRSADVVVVFFHWGTELVRAPSSRQQELAAAALNAGAALVLGAHPHVFGAISRPDAHRLVAWTLGNFVFPSHSDGTGDTGILEVRLDARGVRGYDVIPAYAGVRPTLRHR